MKRPQKNVLGPLQNLPQTFPKCGPTDFPTDFGSGPEPKPSSSVRTVWEPRASVRSVRAPTATLVPVLLRKRSSLIRYREWTVHKSWIQERAVPCRVFINFALFHLNLNCFFKSSSNEFGGHLKLPDFECCLRASRVCVPGIFKIHCQIN
jgi:hypothetical protein